MKSFLKFVGEKSTFDGVLTLTATLTFSLKRHTTHLINPLTNEIWALMEKKGNMNKTLSFYDSDHSGTRQSLWNHRKERKTSQQLKRWKLLNSIHSVNQLTFTKDKQRHYVGWGPEIALVGNVNTHTKFPNYE